MEVTASYASAQGHHSFVQCWAREFAAADRRLEDTAVRRPSGSHLNCMLHRVLRAVDTVVTLGRLVLPNQKQEPPETTVSGEDLRRNVRTPWRLSSHFSKRSLTAAIAAFPMFAPWRK